MLLSGVGPFPKVRHVRGNWRSARDSWPDGPNTGTGSVIKMQNDGEFLAHSNLGRGFLGITENYGTVTRQCAEPMMATGMYHKCIYGGCWDRK